ncbi:MAG: flagellar basal-body rod protein FlgG [Lachnospiraceae bacterium]|nr:flagellar basal-body rod protein FlgG [Lachnospiraceae bacterium]
MVRSLWSAATGMIAQQTNVDTISNNLANVNTTGYKTEVAEFKSLLYQTLQTKSTTANNQQKPIGAQVGLGVRNSSITSIFRQGSFMESSSTSAFAINGSGFFAVRGADGTTYYTRNGNFNWSMGTNGLMLTNSEGYPVLDTNGRGIVLSGDYTVSKITISSDGTICYPDASGNPQSLGVTIGVFQFQNPAGLEKNGNSLFEATAASGAAINEATNANVKKSQVVQGYLEGSNVQVVDEMVNLIVAQRAYEMNSKAIQASDEMLQQANSLKK